MAKVSPNFYKINNAMFYKQKKLKLTKILNYKFVDIKKDFWLDIWKIYCNVIFLGTSKNLKKCTYSVFTVICHNYNLKTSSYNCGYKSKIPSRQATRGRGGVCLIVLDLYSTRIIQILYVLVKRGFADFLKFYLKLKISTIYL